MPATLPRVVVVAPLHALPTPPPASLVAGGDARRGTVGAPGGRPRAGATVCVPGLGWPRVPGVRGAFRLAALPAGRYTLVIRHLGYAPTLVTAAVPGPPLALVL